MRVLPKQERAAIEAVCRRFSATWEFVHNPESDPLLLFSMTSELLGLSRAGTGRAAVTRAGERWLVVISARGSACLEAYRYIHSQLRMANDFQKIVMVSGDGRVGMLTG